MSSECPLWFEISIPSHKTYGGNIIVNRGCLAKQFVTSALRAESIIIPNASDTEARIVNRGCLAKHCPRNPLFRKRPLTKQRTVLV